MNGDDNQKALFAVEPGPEPQGPVECLGMTFESDGARREYFLERLRERLRDPEFRKIEGFPIGSDEDILALSDPPYYTACPNPFIEDFINHYGKPYNPDIYYSKAPFASDSVGSRHNPTYKAHTYHTKVPWEALIPYLRHYLPEGGIILDCFSGSGMTGVAASYASKEGQNYHTVLQDLSPIATFVARNTLKPGDFDNFLASSTDILKEAQNVLGKGWKIKKNPDSEDMVDVAYYVWSEIIICPNCCSELNLWDLGYDKDLELNLIECRNCNFIDKRKNFERQTETYFDKFIGRSRKRIKRIPVFVSYLDGKSRGKRNLSEKERKSAIPGYLGVPVHIATGQKILNKEGEWGVLYRKGYHYGIEYVHDFFSTRSWETISWLWKAVETYPVSIRPLLFFWITSCIMKSSLLMAFNPDGIGRVMKGNLYIGSVTQEMNPLHLLSISREDIKRFLIEHENKKSRSSAFIIDTSSSTSLRFPTNTVDYVLIDPPFGGVVPFVELNFIWESFLNVRSNEIYEVTVNSVRDIGEGKYFNNITKCFSEAFRVLKPSHWMTIIFHNSKNSIWTIIQQAIGMAGFVVVDVRVLDRKQGAIKQVTSTRAVKQDLIISGYKPNGGLNERFKLEAGSEEGVWDFMRSHLKQLPVFVPRNGQAEVIAERQNYLLFDRMVAFHVQRNVTVPLSAAEFYQGLSQRFPERESMYFLPEQAAEYDRKRLTVKEIRQLDLFVNDEASAIQWLKQQLIKKPQTFQDIHPQFLREIGGWQKHEKSLELSLLLEQNFLRYDGKSEVPNQIHGYLSTNYKELRNLAKDDPALQAKARDRWYVPDPNKAGDLEKLRERALLKEFAEYLPPGYKPLHHDTRQGVLPGFKPRKDIPRGQRLKIFRLEAVRAGFKKAWQERDYTTIIAVARRIPETVLQEDHRLLMWYDQARTRLGEYDI